MAKLSDMRILMVCRTMGLGGTENVVLQLCELLVGKVGYLAVASSGGRIIAKLEHLGIVHYEIPDIADKTPANMIIVMHALRSIAHDNSINIVHCHHRMAALYAQIALKKTVRVATAHTVFHDKRTLSRYAYRGFRVAACGKLVEQNLIDFYGLSREDVALIPNSVHPFSGPIKKIKEIALCPEGTLKVGFLGRLSEAKGVRYLIDAIAILINRQIPVMCYIAGEGELEQDLRVRAQQTPEPSRIVFLGRRDDPQNYLAQLDVCTMPSLWEGLPLVLLEAFSVGAAVSASATDGILDVVEDGMDGLLSQPGNAYELADSIERLYKNPNLRKRLSRAAIQKYEREYSYETWTSRYEEFYLEALQ